VAVLLAALLVHRHAAAAAPSFDCAAASGAVERLICANSGLSGEDVRLASAYKILRARAPQPDAAFLDSQRAWLRSRAQVCSLSGREPPADDFVRLRATLCLFNLYEARFHELNTQLGAVPDPTAHFRTEDVTAEQAERLVAALTDGLAHLEPAAHPTRVSCSAMVSYTQLDVSGHDYSYGAACVLQIDKRSLTVMMCDDVLVGMFHAAESTDASPSREEVVRFVAQACPPGG
jgi:uncharacterized protein YecT (DUF1311 family)